MFLRWTKYAGYTLPLIHSESGKRRIGLEKIPSRDQFSDNVDDGDLLERFPEFVMKSVVRLDQCSAECFASRGKV